MIKTSHLTPSTKIINENFIIRYKNDKESFTRLIGAGQYSKLVGEKLKNKHFKRVLNDGLDKHTFKIRNRLRIDFVSK